MTATATHIASAASVGPFDSWLANRADTLPTVPWLTAERNAARARVVEQGAPTSKSEGWRYTGLRTLLDQAFTPVEEPLTALLPDDIDDVLIPDLDSIRVVLVNGHYAPALSRLGELPKGARIGGLRETLAQDPDALEGLLTSVAGEGRHVFASLNTAGMDDGLVLLLERGVVVERPVELIHVSIGMDDPRVAQPRHLVRLGDGAQAELVLDGDLYRLPVCIDPALTSGTAGLPVGLPGIAGLRLPAWGEIRVPAVWQRDLVT